MGLFWPLFGFLSVWSCDFVSVCQCGCVADLLCFSVVFVSFAVWLCGSVVVWLCSYVALCQCVCVAVCLC